MKEKILNLFYEIKSLSQINSMIIEILFLFLFLLIFDYFQRRLIKKLRSELSKKENGYSYIKALLKTIKNPISWIVYIIAITVSFEIINSYFEIKVIEKLVHIRSVSITFCVGYFIIRFIKELKSELANNINSKNSVDKTTIQIYANISIIVVFVIFTLLILQDIGVSVSGLLAFGGVGGLIAGFSAKELLSDFFGGLVLMSDKPFKVGDWIKSPDRDIEGVVEEIGMRRICIRTFDKRPLYVPNSIMATITIENPSRMTNRRIFERINVRYKDADKLSQITRKVKDMLERHSGIDTEQTLIVNADSFGEHSIEFFIYTFTKTTDWVTYHGIKHNILLTIYDIIKEEGAEIAIPINETIFKKQGSLMKDIENISKMSHIEN